MYPLFDGFAIKLLGFSCYYYLFIEARQTSYFFIIWFVNLHFTMDNYLVADVDDNVIHIPLLWPVPRGNIFNQDHLFLSVIFPLITLSFALSP